MITSTRHYPLGNGVTSVVLAALLLGGVPVFAAGSQDAPMEHEQLGAAQMAADMEQHPTTNGPPLSDRKAPIDMGSMQGGSPPPGARDPNAWSDGYEYTGMEGFEETDQIPIGLFLLDEFEFVSGDDGDGLAWSLQAAYGGDTDKLWLRSQGLQISGEDVDANTDVEALWWHAYAPFWGTVLGARQDIGPGAHSWLAFGIEGLVPYWFELGATGYVGDDGRLAARLQASYDLLLTNRLILTPELESNVYSKAESERGLGSGLGNVELGLRLRYELRREFAPYIGYVWERAFGDTADLLRAEGGSASEHRFVAGLRLWW